VDASVYRTNVRDDIFLFPYTSASEPEGSTIDGFFDNIARTRREGIELSARAAFGEHRVHASWSLTRATFQTRGIELFSIREAIGGENDVEPGDRLPLVPDQTLSAGATIALPLGLDAGLDLRYVGRRWLRGDEANETRPLGGAGALDARLGWEWGAWELQAIVRNVFDRRWSTFGTYNLDQSTGDVTRFLTPSQPRQLRVVVRRGV
jgi:outer membrane cobalamin receptor